MGAITIDYGKVRNPQLRKWIEEEFHDELFDIVAGHDHDGTNSKTLSPAAVIKADSVGTSAIQNLAVTKAKIAADAIDGTKLADAAVDSEHIAAGAVDTAHIADDQVTNDKLANITRGSIKVGGADNAPTDLVAKTNKQILIGDGTDVKSVPVSGDITITNAGVTAIGAAKITTAMLGLTTTPFAKAIVAAHEAEIPVTGNGDLALTIGDVAETNTLAVPTFAGQVITISADTVAGTGSRTITVASPVNAAGNNTILLDAAGEFISLYGIKIGATFAWRVFAIDGATLSTVA